MEEQENNESYVPQDDNWAYPRLSDVVGADEYRQTLEDIVSCIEKPELYEYLGLKPDKSFLFYGSPGTGKTFSVKAVRNELVARGVDVAWMPYDIGTYGTAYINMGAVNLTKYFNNGKKAAARGHTVIHFFDEADVVFRSRGEDNARHKEDDKVTDAMLKQLGALNEHGERRYVFLATNFIDQLDYALRRAGRIDKYLETPMPGEKALYLAYRAKMKSANKRGVIPLFKGLNARQLTRLSKGFSYADVDEVVKRCIVQYARTLLRSKENIEEIKPFTQSYVERVIESYREERFGKKRVGKNLVGYERWRS